LQSPVFDLGRAILLSRGKFPPAAAAMLSNAGMFWPKPEFF
jgi:hypothetical protein